MLTKYKPKTTIKGLTDFGLSTKRHIISIFFFLLFFKFPIHSEVYLIQDVNFCFLCVFFV